MDRLPDVLLSYPGKQVTRMDRLPDVPRGTSGNSTPYVGGPDTGQPSHPYGPSTGRPTWDTGLLFWHKILGHRTAFLLQFYSVLGFSGGPGGTKKKQRKTCVFEHF